MNSKRLIDQASDKDPEYSQAYLEQFSPKEREKRVNSIIKDIKDCSRLYGCIFIYRPSVGNSGDWVESREFSEEDKGLCATYRVLAEKISDEKIKYWVGDFKPAQENTVLRAPACKINLEEKLK